MPQDSHERLSHKKLAEHIETELHVNLYEHRENVVKFIGYFLVYALLGVFAGGLMDYLINKGQGSDTSKGSCFWWLVANLTLTGGLFFVLLLVKRGIRFDDWMLGTFVGFIFSLCFFSAQGNLSKNMQCILDVVY